MKHIRVMPRASRQFHCQRQLAIGSSIPTTEQLAFQAGRGRHRADESGKDYIGEVRIGNVAEVPTIIGHFDA